MSTEEIFKRYIDSAKIWIEALNSYSDAAFNTNVNSDQWSIAQVYDHIIKVTHECLQRVQLCAGTRAEAGHSGFGPALFSLMGAFPPFKLKIKNIPVGLEHIYLPQAISKNDAEKGLKECIALMEEHIQVVATSNPSLRIKHWAGGWFNAKQWYHSAEMHLKHHLRQKKRIDKLLLRRF